MTSSQIDPRLDGQRGPNDLQETELRNPEARRMVAANARRGAVGSVDSLIPKKRSWDKQKIGILGMALDAQGKTLFLGGIESTFMVDLVTMDARVIRKELGEKPTISPDGSLLAFLEEERLCMRETGGAGGKRLDKRVSGNVIDALAISPDNAMCAYGRTNEGVTFIDCATGDVVNTVGMQESCRGLVFTPDTQGLFVLHGMDRMTLIHPDGRTSSQEGTSIAFSADGRRVAMVGKKSAKKGHRLTISKVEALWPLKTTSERKCRLPKGMVMGIDNLCFSPDGERLAATYSVFDVKKNQMAYHMSVFEAATGALTHEIGLPDRPESGAEMPLNPNLGFSADHRLFYKTRGRLTPWDQEEATGVVFVFDLSDEGATYLGGLTSDVDGLIMELPFGVSATFTRGPQNADEARAGIVQSGLLGRDFTSLLARPERHRMEELRDRVEFFGGLIREGRLDRDADLRALVKASKGVTHLLPVIADQAAQSTSQRARFGGSGETLGASTLMQTIEALKDAGEDEQAQHFQDKLQALEEAFARAHRSDGGDHTSEGGAASSSRKIWIVAIVGAIVVLMGLVMLAAAVIAYLYFVA